jgi:hypothetical protein
MKKYLVKESDKTVFRLAELVLSGVEARIYHPSPPCFAATMLENAAKQDSAGVGRLRIYISTMVTPSHSLCSGTTPKTASSPPFFAAAMLENAAKQDSDGVSRLRIYISTIVTPSPPFSGFGE